MFCNIWSFGAYPIILIFAGTNYTQTQASVNEMPLDEMTVDKMSWLPLFFKFQNFSRPFQKV